MLSFEDGGSLYRKRIKKTSAGEATLDIDDSIVLEGKAIVYERVSVENRTTGYTRLVVGVVSADLFHQHEEHDNPGVDDIFWTTDDINVKQGENLRLRLTGTTNGDTIFIYVEGRIGKPGNPFDVIKDKEEEKEREKREQVTKEKRRLEVTPHKLHFFPRENLNELINIIREEWKAQIKANKTGDEMPTEIEDLLKSMFDEITEEVTFHIEHMKSLWKDPGDPTLYRTFAMPPAIETETRTIYSLIGKTKGK